MRAIKLELLKVWFQIIGFEYHSFKIYFHTSGPYEFNDQNDCMLGSYLKFVSYCNI